MFHKKINTTSGSSRAAAILNLFKNGALSLASEADMIGEEPGVSIHVSLNNVLLLLNDNNIFRALEPRL